MDTSLEKQKINKLPIVHFTAENLKAGTENRRSTCKAVREAMEEFSSFIAVYDNGGNDGDLGPGPELMRSVFSSLEELFDLPEETKSRNISEIPGFGYFGRTPERLVETVGIGDSTSLEAVQSFADLMWPSGNNHFCETIHQYATQTSKVGEILTRIIFESYGVNKYCESHINSSSYLFRANSYRAPESNNETNVGVAPHTDATFISILQQDEVGGLEVKYSKDGYLDSC